jgi:hypothetical protein
MNKYPEFFKKIDNYDYEVSNYGNVRNSIKMNILEHKTINMRASVRLFKEVEGEKFKQLEVCYVNELVCKYFLRQYNGEFIYHRDKDRHNCHVSNLSFKKKPDLYNYLVYFDISDHYRVYDSATKTISDMDKLPRDANKFHLFKGYEATDESLLQYADDFKKWCIELNNSVLKIVYQKYTNHYAAVENIFKMFCKGNYEHFEPISSYENDIINKTSNGGLIALNEKYKNKDVLCFSVDFSANYPTILQLEELKVPTTTFTETILKELPKDIELGIYHVNITSNNPELKHVFAFSAENHYTDISLKFALKHKKKFDINIELVQDNKTNAYVYKEFVTGRSIFGDWYDKLIELKKLFPKNKLVKHLMASVWGMICHLSITNKTYDEIVKEDIKIGVDYDIYEIKKSGYKNEYYELIPLKSNLYKYNIRIKSFLTSYARMNIANVILDGDNLNYFVRAQTDSATFTRPIDYTKFKGLVPEDKTSGLIHWDRVNKYQNKLNHVRDNLKTGLKLIEELDKQLLFLF